MVLFFTGGAVIGILLLVVFIGMLSSKYGTLDDAATSAAIQGLTFIVLCGIAAMMMFKS